MCVSVYRKLNRGRGPCASECSLNSQRREVVVICSNINKGAECFKLNMLRLSCSSSVIMFYTLVIALPLWAHTLAGHTDFLLTVATYNHIRVGDCVCVCVESA
ncbi:hypothetical protein ILYODFUR_000091 [Ilyodon furcidens]|uniref:Uncharacterized protein n=1 Tax=Ilyodon furcidens TaxID=33524 RepID=A0ABV0U1F4_9TELE